MDTLLEERAKWKSLVRRQKHDIYSLQLEVQRCQQELQHTTATYEARLEEKNVLIGRLNAENQRLADEMIALNLEIQVLRSTEQPNDTHSTSSEDTSHTSHTSHRSTNSADSFGSLLNMTKQLGWVTLGTAGVMGVLTLVSSFF